MDLVDFYKYLLFLLRKTNENVDIKDSSFYFRRSIFMFFEEKHGNMKNFNWLFFNIKKACIELLYFIYFYQYLKFENGKIFNAGKNRK